MVSAKSFCYSCLGILALTAAYTLGACQSSATGPKSLEPGTLPAGKVLAADNGILLLTDGRMVYQPSADWWVVDRETSLPVPVDQVALFTMVGGSYGGPLIVDRSGNSWRYNAEAGWRNTGKPEETHERQGG